MPIMKSSTSIGFFKHLKGFHLLIVMFCFFLVLSGCVFQRARTAQSAKSALVGLTKDELLSCAGVPTRSERVNGREYLTYVGGGDSRGSIVSRRDGSDRVSVYSTQQRYCEATFILKDGVVQKVFYRGRTGGLLTEGEQCAFIVEGCL